MTEIVNALIKLMGAEEQKAFLASMSAGEQPGRRAVPMTKEEQWWYGKLGQGARRDWEWKTIIPVDDLLTEFIEAVDWTKTRRGARSALGTMLKKLCPGIRCVKGDYLMPPVEQARKDFLEVCPGIGHSGPRKGSNGEKRMPRMRLAE